MGNRDTMTVFINYRLLDAKGQFLGVTGVGVTLKTLQKLLQGIEKRFERRVYFADTHGKIVLANSEDLELGGSLQAIPNLRDVAAQLLNKNAVTTSASYKNGSSMVLVHSRFIPELKWFLVVEQDEATIIEPLTRLPLIGLILADLTFLVMLWVAISSRFGSRKPAQ